MAPGSAKLVVLGLLAVILPGPTPPPVATHPASPRPTSSRRDPVASLSLLENELRAKVDFATLPAYDAVSGPDPGALLVVPALDAAVGLLHGGDAIVVVGADGTVKQQLPTARRPTAIARLGQELLVASAFAPRLERFAVTDQGLRADGVLALPGVVGISVLASGEEGVLYVGENHSHRLLVVPAGGEPTAFGECHGAAALLRVERWLVALCSLDHEVRVYDVDARGVPRPAPLVGFRHDGPIWSLSARRAGESLWLAAGGVEDRPLDRRGGVFGYVDSFVFVYELELGSARLTRRADVNVSALGVVTPRWLALEGAGEVVVVDVTGEGSDRRARLVLDGASGRVVEESARAFPVGVTGVVGWNGHELAASGLLDAWIVDGKIRPLPGGERDVEMRLGELLVHTTLIAPSNPADGRRSRFTCATCHDGGYGDGRVHNAGRGEVIAATRPLRGLGNGRPYFSRALDRTMAVMVHAEFGAAARGSGHADWFVADASVAPWLAEVPGLDPAARYSPLELRRALLTFLTRYTHSENPAAQNRERFSIEEARGAELFKARCEDCHQARLITDLPETRIPYEKWPEMILGTAGPITWSSDVYAKTGVEPYVHPEGARVPSLRRIHRKFPYFTTGAARSLPELLGKARWEDGQFRHAGERASGDQLSDEEIVSLTAFLHIL